MTTHLSLASMLLLIHLPSSSFSWSIALVAACLLQLQRASQRFSVDTARYAGCINLLSRGTNQSSFYAAEFCLVLKWLHEQGVIYRNVKLENILLGLDGHIRVVDFGICKTAIQKGEHTRSFVGTTEFMAPEVCLTPFSKRRLTAET